LTSEARVVRESPIGAFAFEPHNCFACGTLNTNGLQLVVHLDPQRASTEFRLDRRFEGWEGMAHGGIICTILDEVMGWALIAAGDWGVTARMSVAFSKPVPVGASLRADAWITSTRRRIVEAESRLIDAESGIELATATGTYLAADAAKKRELAERYGFRTLRDSAATPEPVDSLR
jgi:acyl-coenzyme A thioesterase PaaI-like protein